MVMSATLGSVLAGVRVRQRPTRTARPSWPAVRVRPAVQIACPAAALRSAEIARRVVDQGMWVDVRSGAELDEVLTASVSPKHIGVHCDDLSSNEMVWAASLDVGRLVVSSAYQAEMVSCVRGRRPHNVWLQSGSDAAVLDGCRGLRLAGLDASCGDCGYAHAIDALMGESADLRKETGIIIGHLGISGWQLSSDVVDEVDDAVTEGCIRYRLPRPQVTLCGSTLTT